MIDSLLVIADLSRCLDFGEGSHPLEASSLLVVIPDRIRKKNAIVARGPDEVTSDVTKSIAAHRPRFCLVLMHLSTLNPDVKRTVPENVAQARLEILEERLRSDKGVQDVTELEVHGYHNESSEVSRVLDTFRGQNLSGLLSAVRAAIGQRKQSDMFNDLSVVKHKIVGLFLPIDLRVQHALASGVRINEPGLADRLRAARDLLVASRSVVTKPAATAAFNKSLALLADSTEPSDPRLASFHEWLNALDSALNTLRKEMT